MNISKDSLPYNFDENDFKEYILAYQKIKRDLINSDSFSFPSFKVFSERILHFFDYNLENASYRVITFEDIHKKFSPEALYYEKYIIPDTYMFEELSDENLDESDYNFFLKEIIEYNKMIFYDDIGATNWIKNNSPTLLIDLVRTYNYTENKSWLQFVFKKTKLYEPQELEQFLFTVNCIGKDYTEGGECKKTISILRKDMLDKMIEYGAELSQLSTVANIVSNGNPQMYEEDTEELYAYLMAHCYKAGQSGIIEYLYDTNPKMIEVFRKKDFYGIEDLEDFTDNFYKPQNKRFGLSSIGPDPYIAYGVINDPDGYTNLRDGKGTSAKVIKKIKEGEKFGIETNTGEWWIVVTEDGTRGRIHSSRVTVIKE
ncbi:SH3 domain-containing protein [Aquimarina muelleri]|uniref:SH3 domain-containing protein n=1 Tax=Aquimarina muelleri TaxID=279356 RepID=UPI003F682A12